MSSKSYFKYETFNYDSKGNYFGPFPFNQQYILNDYLNSLNLNAPAANNAGPPPSQPPPPPPPPPPGALNHNGLSLSNPNISKSPCTVSTTPLHLNFGSSGSSGGGGGGSGGGGSMSLSPNVAAGVNPNATLTRTTTPTVTSVGSLNNLSNLGDDYRPPPSTTPHHYHHHQSGNNTLRFQYGTLKIREREHHRSDKSVAASSSEHHHRNVDHHRSERGDYRHHERGDYLTSTLKHRHSMKGHSRTRTYQIPLTPQKLLVARHGERVDTTFGPEWINMAFESQTGRYVRFNLNMPKTLPNRDSPYDFLFDPPLTEVGMFQARLNGEELAANGFNLSHVYVSPALRSIQTADKILEGMNLKHIIPLRIEPGLFELMSWQAFIPNKYPFIDPYKLKAAGFNIDLGYRPVIPFEYLRSDENEEIFYQRSFYLTKTIVDRHSESGNILMVGHAPTVEGCTRQLTGNRPRSTEEFVGVTRKVPFLSIIQCEKNMLTGQWSLSPPPVPAMRHLCLEEFDWNNLYQEINPGLGGGMGGHPNMNNNNNMYNNYNMTVENLGYSDGSGYGYGGPGGGGGGGANNNNYGQMPQPPQQQQQQHHQQKWCAAY